MTEATPKTIAVNFAKPIANVQAFCTTRLGGVSLAPFASFNLADHVNEPLDKVYQNRAILQQMIGSNVTVSWLNQTHSTDVAIIESVAEAQEISDADAQVTALPNIALAVMTADCLPIIFSTLDGTMIAVAHGGWRGLCGGIIANTIEAMQCQAKDLCVWLGPCISQDCFEVGEAVRTEFVESNRDHAIYFRPSGRYDGKYYADLQGIATFQLKQLGVKNITANKLCTYQNQELLYSYRRDGITGRMATVIWRNA